MGSQQDGQIKLFVLFHLRKTTIYLHCKQFCQYCKTKTNTTKTNTNTTNEFL